MVSYPHPVIGNADDVAAQFTMSGFTFHSQTTIVRLEFDIRTTDSDVLDMVDGGHAFLAVRVMCGRTFYNNTKNPTLFRTSEGWHGQVDIDADLLDGPTTAELLLLTTQPLEGLSWAQQHPDFLDAEFDVPSRAVIGTGGVATFDVRKSYDPLRPPLESFMRFQEALPPHPQEFSVVVSYDGIIVMIGPHMYPAFEAMHAVPALQFNAVVLPALMQALVEIDGMKEDDDTRQSAWCQGLLRQLEDRGLSKKSALERAQALLEGPFGMLRRADLLGMDGEDEDES